MGGAGGEERVNIPREAIRARLAGTRRSGQHALRAVALVWRASPLLTTALAVMTLVAALVPPAVALVSQILGLRLGIDVNVAILEKAIGLSLPAFEDSELYDAMTRARREAST